MGKEDKRIILHVDSEDGIRMLMKQIFLKHGVQEGDVVSVQSADEAREQLDQFSEDAMPQLLVFRFGPTPEEDKAFLSSLRAQNSRYADIRLILIDEYDSYETKRFCERYHVDAFMTLEDVPQQLGSQIEQLLG